MRRAGLVATAAVALSLTACRAESHRGSHAPVEAPVSAANAIPDAPLNGTLHGTQFVLRDARYVVDRRVGFAHTDLKLSAGKAESPCGPIAPARAASVWLRLEGEPLVGATEFKVNPAGEVSSTAPTGGDAGAARSWSVHYQVFEDERWTGVGEGSAVVSIRELGPDGRLSGGLAVCFSDDRKSCVSGSFDAQSCPPTIDQPVRGALPAESPPPQFKLQLLDTGSAPDAAAPRAGAPLGPHR
jgi:hypothetical protein